MINEQNFPFYLRCLVRVSNSRQISADDIPQIFRNFFSLPALFQSLNLSISNSLSINWLEIEEYVDQNTFDNFESLAEGISEKFQSDIEKFYASYYFVVRNFSFDFDRNVSLDDQNPLNSEELFSQKKGISIDITNFLIELSKSENISDDISFSFFRNKSKETNWNSFNPPQTAEFDHENVLVDFKGEKFISDPTFSIRCSEKNQSTGYQFKKSNFLIPYYSALLMYFQEGAADDFTFDRFASLNKPNFEKDLSFESNPFQKITVENGFYEMQFSFLQPDDSIGAEISMLVDDEWTNKPAELVSLTCLEKDLPNRHFSLNSELRCRYKMTVSFPEIGNYEAKVKLGDQILFNVYFDVVSLKEKFLTFGIPDSMKEESGFIPILPTDELTSVTNGYARIRFAIKNTNSSAIIVKLFKIKEGTFECDDEKSVDNCCRFFSVDFPFEIEYDNKFHYSFVEDWILVEFPEEGRWEVKVLFGNTQTYNISYFFDVTGKCEHNVFPIFDLPSNRTFSNFPVNPLINVEPSTQSVFVDQNDLNFVVYSPNELKLSFKFDKDGSIIEPKLDAKKEWEDKPVKNWEYSVTFPEEGMYTLEIWDDEKYIGAQNYFFGNVDRIEETQEKIDLMENIKTVLTEKADYCKDIPISIKEEVERMFQESKEDDQDQQNEQDKDQQNEQMNELVEGQIDSLINQDQQNEQEQSEQMNGLVEGQIDSLIDQDQQNEQEQSEQMNELVEGQIDSLINQDQQNEQEQNEQMIELVEDQNKENQQNEQEHDNNEQNNKEQANHAKTTGHIPQIHIEVPQYDDQEYQRSPRSRGNQTFSPRSMASSSRSFNRPQLKKRPIKTKPPILYTPPTYKKTESTNELQKLKEKAKKEEPLLNVPSDTLEDLLNLLYEDKKSYATKHLYKNGLICNNMIAHVMKYYEIAKRKENQDFEREKFTQINKKFEESLQSFDKETKDLEKELLSEQNNKRNQLKEKQDNELTDFDNHWNSAKKQRTYNHSTNNLNALRSKLSFLLVDGRFKDAEEVQKQVNERTSYEQVSHAEIMKDDHDTSLKFLRDKHNDELETFEKNCAVEMEKLRQDRTKLRQCFLNTQLKLRTKEEIIADPNKLWMHSKTERMGNTMKNSINNGTTINSSSKMKRADIKETDAVILNLPPLESSKKSPRGKTKKVKKEEE